MCATGNSTLSSREENTFVRPTKRRFYLTRRKLMIHRHGVGEVGNRAARDPARVSIYVGSPEPDQYRSVGTRVVRWFTFAVRVFFFRFFLLVDLLPPIGRSSEDPVFDIKSPLVVRLDVIFSI